MFRGDLSNEATARLVMVFEGALGTLPEDEVGRFNALGSAGRWYDAAHLWEFDDLMARKIMDVTYRQGFELECVTYAGPQAFADELYERFGWENLPIRRCVATTADVMARRVSYAPDIAAVYDANPETQFMYGSKARPLHSIHDLGR